MAKWQEAPPIEPVDAPEQASQGTPAWASAPSVDGAEDAFEAGLRRQAENQPGYLSNTARGVGDRTTNMLGNLLQLPGTVIERTEEYLDERFGRGGGVMWGTDEGLASGGYEADFSVPLPFTDKRFGLDFTGSANPEHTGLNVDAAGQLIEDVDFGYEPNYTVDQAMDDPSVRNIAGAIGEQGPQALVDMGALFLNPAAYLGARSQEIAEERVENDGREGRPTLEDLSYGGAGATWSTLADRLALGKLLPGGAGAPIRRAAQVPGAMARAGLTEGLTEAIQEGGIEYLAETYGTEKALSVQDAVRRGIGGALIGAPIGGGVRGVSATVEMRQNVRQELANEGVDPDALNDELVDRLIQQAQAASEGTTLDPEALDAAIRTGTGMDTAPRVGEGLPKKDARAARGQVERELGDVFGYTDERGKDVPGATDVYRREDVTPGEEGLELREGAQPLRDPTGEQATPESYGSRSLAARTARDLGVTLDEEGIRLAARDIQADPQADPAAIVRSYSQEDRGRAFDRADVQRRRGEEYARDREGRIADFEAQPEQVQERIRREYANRGINPDGVANAFNRAARQGDMRDVPDLREEQAAESRREYSRPAFEAAERRRQRREEDLATGERVGSQASTYRTAEQPYERQGQREVVLLDARRDGEGRLRAGEAVEVLARAQRQTPKGGVEDMARIVQGDNDPVWVPASRLTEVQTPENPRMYSEALGETREPPRGVMTGRGDSPAGFDASQTPQPRRAVDRQADPDGLRRGLYSEAEPEPGPEGPGPQPRAEETFDGNTGRPYREAETTEMTPQGRPRTEFQGEGGEMPITRTRRPVRESERPQPTPEQRQAWEAEPEDPLAGSREMSDAELEEMFGGAQPRDETAQPASPQAVNPNAPEGLSDPQTAQVLRDSKNEYGWAERGGNLLRDREGKPTGRTRWLPRNQELMDALKNKKVTEDGYKKLVDRALDPEAKPLTNRQRNILEEVLDAIDPVRRERLEAETEADMDEAYGRPDQEPGTDTAQPGEETAQDDTIPAKGPLEVPADEFVDAYRQINDEQDPRSPLTPPDKVTRAADKAKGKPEMSAEQADAKLDEWRNHALEQGKRGVNSDRVVVSLFDVSGEWSQPWRDAGYDVYTFDIQTGQDINEFSPEYLADYLGLPPNVDVILAAPPCTDFSGSGSWTWPDKDADGRTEAAIQLVRQTLATVDYFKPGVWAMENPVGRLRGMLGINPTLIFDPHHYGDPYTKKTLLWGDFEPDLPQANVDPVEGSKIAKLSGKDKFGRSLTPAGFAYSFFMENNLEDMTAGERVTRQYRGLDRNLVEAALDSGVAEETLVSRIQDDWNDGNLEAANDTLSEMVDGFDLETQTEGSRRAEEQQTRERADQERRQRLNEERRAQADRDRDDFTLTGSDRTADEAAARGQMDLTDQAAQSRDNQAQDDTPRPSGGGTQLYSGIPLDRIAAAVKRALGGERRAWREQLQDNADFMTAVKDASKGNRAHENPLMAMFRSYWYDADNRLREIAQRMNMPGVRRIADAFAMQAGDATGSGRLDYHSRLQRRLNTRLREVERIRERGKRFDLDRKPDTLQRLRKLVENPRARRSGAMGDLAAQIETFFKQELEYLRRAGIEVGEVKGYMPRVIDRAKINGSATKPRFIAAAAKAYQIDNPRMTAADAHTAAELRWQRELYGEQNSTPGWRAEASSPGKANATKSRKLSQRAVEQSGLTDFMVNDPFQVMIAYTQNAALRAELASTEIELSDGSTVTLGDNWSNWETIRDDLLREGGDDAYEVMDQVQDLVAVTSGIKARTYHGRTAKAFSWIRTISTMGLLELSTVTSLPEPLIAGIRMSAGGSTRGAMRDTANVLRSAARYGGDAALHILRLPKRERLQATYDLLEGLGEINANNANAMSIDRFAGGDPASAVQSRILASYFRGIRLEQFTNYTSVFAAENAMTFMRQLVKDLDAGGKRAANARFHFQDLNIPAGEVDAVAGYIRQLGKRNPTLDELSQARRPGQLYGNAISKFVNESRMLPTASSKPAWAAHPVGAAVFQLQSFPFSFTKQVLKRPLRNIRNAPEEVGKLSAALGVVPFMAGMALVTGLQTLLGELRDELNEAISGKEAPEQSEAFKLERALSWAGAFGKLDPVIQTISGSRYQRSTLESLAGPTLGRGFNALDDALGYVTNNSPNTNTAEQTLWKAVMDVGVEPLLQAAASLVPDTGVTGAAMLGARAVGPRYLRDNVGQELFPREPNDDKRYSLVEELLDLDEQSGGRSGGRSGARGSGRSGSRDGGR